MDKKSKFKSLASNVGKSAKELFDNAIQTADQNDDGKFDMEDVSVLAEAVGKSVKKGTQALKENVDEKSKMLELKTLQPIFIDSLNSSDFLLPKFIRITERTKKYIDSEVCQGSIGFVSNQKGLQIVNIFRDSLNIFGLTFSPDSEDEFYYVDPSDRDQYISLDEYFGYLKVARINELQKIAQDLGAKYFKVTYKEEKTSFTAKNIKAHANIKEIADADADHSSSEKKYSTVEMAAEMSFPGHTPVEPELKYLQRDTNIQNLIKMRMNEQSPLLNQKLMLKMSNSSGMKEADAVKIDAVLKGMKCSGNTTVSSEAKNESRRYLEYEIVF